MIERVSYAKVSRPRLFGVVPRERLFRLLDDNRGRALISITGPPGAGKTALLASYIEQRALNGVWYQLDSGDADPASFFHYLVVAAQTSASFDTSALPRFAAEHTNDLASFARLFFRAYFAQLPEHSLFVLDNYQEVDSDSLFHDVVRQAIAEVPPAISAVAISRADPPAAFLQFVVAGAMVSVGWDQLQLTLDEVRAVSAQRQVSDAWLVNALHRESQGWAGGVTLMLERLHHLDGGAQQLPLETRESVFNYFASLIFDQVPHQARHILLSVAFLPRVTYRLARSLSGSDAASSLLDDLYRRSLFIDRRPGVEHTYQFHALFLDFLRARAEASLGEVQLADLLRRSAAALEGSSDAEAAIDLWLTAREWQEAKRLAMQEANRLLSQGRRQTLTQWLTLLPDSIASTDPWVLYWLGRAKLQVAPQDGLSVLKSALPLFRALDDPRGYIECLAAALNGAFHGFHATSDMDALLDELLAALEASSAVLTGEAELRVMSVLCMTLFHVRPWHPLMMPTYLRMEALLHACDDPAIALIGGMAALVVSGLCGDFERGDRLVWIVEPLALRPEASPSDAAWAYAQIGWLRFIEARYEEALASLRRTYTIAKENGLKQAAIQSVLWCYTIQWRVGDWAAALQSLAEVEVFDAPLPPMTEAQLRLFQARAARHRTAPSEASRLACLSQEAALQVGSRVQELVFSVSNADVHLDAGRIDRARPLLTLARNLVERAPAHRCFLPSVLLLEARCLLEEGDRAAALIRLHEALTLAEQGNHRYYLRFCDWSMPIMFDLALNHRIHPELVIGLIRTFRLRAPPHASDHWPWPVRVHTLGRFEIEVDGQPLTFSRKLPRKTLLLLKAIAAHGPRELAEQVLCDQLWEDEDGDAAHNALSITVLRLRKLVGRADAVLQQGGKLCLNRECCWVDAWSFEANVSRDALAEALELYLGIFLPEEEEKVWSVPSRERLRAKFIQALLRRGAALEQQGQFVEALACYVRGMDADAIVEDFSLGAMRCYEQLDRRTEAFSVYRRLKHTLSVVLGVTPSESTQRLFAEMLERQRHSAAS